MLFFIPLDRIFPSANCQSEFAENGDMLGTKKIKIENDAILVSKSESASNLIA
jgi:hypothetical protein